MSADYKFLTDEGRRRVEEWFFSTEFNSWEERNTAAADLLESLLMHDLDAVEDSEVDFFAEEL